MQREWEQAARALLADAGVFGPQQSALALARDLGIDVIAGAIEEPSRLLGMPPCIVLSDQLDEAQQEARTALELAAVALRRADLPYDELAARWVASRLFMPLGASSLRTALQGSLSAAAWDCDHVTWIHFPRRASNLSG